MLKKKIKYEDFNGEEVEEVFYFHLSKTELLKMENEQGASFKNIIERIMDSNDRGQIIEEFQKLILRCYGVKTDDGKRFIKSDELRTEFSQSAAYDILFTELATDDRAASDFFSGVIPKDLVESFGEAQKQMAAETAQQSVTAGPPPPPQR